ncbi:MAG: hypothetical protein ACLT2Z_01900 [Eubacterium sp.]
MFKDPLFANLEAGDLHLKSKGGRWDGTKWVADTVTSPCINAGNPSRIIQGACSNGNRVNIGAMETQLKLLKLMMEPLYPATRKLRQVRFLQQVPQIIMVRLLRHRHQHRKLTIRW